MIISSVVILLCTQHLLEVFARHSRRQGKHASNDVSTV